MHLLNLPKRSKFETRQLSCFCAAGARYFLESISGGCRDEQARNAEEYISICTAAPTRKFNMQWTESTMVQVRAQVNHPLDPPKLGFSFDALACQLSLGGGHSGRANEACDTYAILFQRIGFLYRRKKPDFLCDVHICGVAISRYQRACLKTSMTISEATIPGETADGAREDLEVYNKDVIANAKAGGTSSFVRLGGDKSLARLQAVCGEFRTVS